MGILRVIFTTSIIEPEREAIYVKCITDTIAKISVPAKFYITENNGKRPTALDTIQGAEVVYTDTNVKINTHYKAIKEFTDVLMVATMHEFDEDDIIIKQTGRYPIESDSFFRTVYNNQEKYDVFMKFYNICTREFNRNDCLMGLYGIRYSELTNFNYFSVINHQSAEVVFATFIRNTITPDRICELDHIDQYFQGSGHLLV